MPQSWPRSSVGVLQQPGVVEVDERELGVAARHGDAVAGKAGANASVVEAFVLAVPGRVVVGDMRTRPSNSVTARSRPAGSWEMPW